MAKSKNWKPRPKQPKCPGCGKALYKHMPVEGKIIYVKKEDPYKYCRNKGCELCGDITEHGHQPLSAPGESEQPEVKTKGDKPAKKAKAKDQPVTRAEPDKPTKKKKNKAKTKSTIEDAPKPQDAPTPKEAPEAKKTSESVDELHPLCNVCGRVQCVCFQLGKDDEPGPVKQARDRIARALAKNGKYASNLVGLVLTMLAQELGNNAISNKLIADYRLDRFGFTKKEANTAQ